MAGLRGFAIGVLEMSPATWVRLRGAVNAQSHLDIEVDREMLSSGVVGYLYGARVIVSPLITDNDVVLQADPEATAERLIDTITLDFGG